MEDTESDALLDQQKATLARMDEAERQLAAFVGFDHEHKLLAGCYVSIAQDGTPFIEKGLVKPEHRKRLERMLRGEDGDAAPEKGRSKDALPESLRRDLAAYRQQIAQLEIAKHPALAFDLLAFKVASYMLDGTRPIFDGPDVQLRRHEARPGSQKQPTIAAQALHDVRKSLPDQSRQPKSEAARFEAFRSLPQEAKLQLLAYGVAITLQAKLATATDDQPTAYDTALALTEADVAAYWRPSKDSFLIRLTRSQLLTVARDTLGEAWAHSRADEKKATLVEQIDRAFADPAKHGRTPEQVEKLKTWLPAGMTFAIRPTPKPANSRKARKAA